MSSTSQISTTMSAMAFGFPFANYKERIQTSSDKEAVRQSVLRAFDSLGWKPEMKGDDKYRCFIRDPDGRSYDEYVTVTLFADGSLLIKSRCAYMQIIDFGKNKEHVENFKSHFTLGAA